MRIINQHIPKTGTQTTQKIFGEKTIVYGKYKLNSELPIIANLISFTVIREPLSRFKSCVKMFLDNSHYSKDLIIDIALNNDFDGKYHLGLEWENTDISIGLHSLSIFHNYINVFDKNSFKSQYLIDFNNLVKELKLIAPKYSNNFDLCDNSYFKFEYHENKSNNFEINLLPSQKIDFENKFERDLEFYDIFKKERII